MDFYTEEHDGIGLCLSNCVFTRVMEHQRKFCIAAYGSVFTVAVESSTVHLGIWRKPERRLLRSDGDLFIAFNWTIWLHALHVADHGLDPLSSLWRNLVGLVPG